MVVLMRVCRPRGRGAFISNWSDFSRWCERAVVRWHGASRARRSIRSRARGGSTRRQGTTGSRSKASAARGTIISRWRSISELWQSMTRRINARAGKTRLRRPHTERTGAIRQSSSWFLTRAGLLDCTRARSLAGIIAVCARRLSLGPKVVDVTVPGVNLLGRSRSLGRWSSCGSGSSPLRCRWGTNARSLVSLGMDVLRLRGGTIALAGT